MLYTYHDIYVTVGSINDRIGMKNKQKIDNSESDKIFDVIDQKTARKLLRLCYMGEIRSDIIKKLVDHAHICDKWWLDRDEDEL